MKDQDTPMYNEEIKQNLGDLRGKMNGIEEEQSSRKHK